MTINFRDQTINYATRGIATCLYIIYNFFVRDFAAQMVDFEFVQLIQCIIRCPCRPSSDSSLLLRHSIAHWLIVARQ